MKRWILLAGAGTGVAIIGYSLLKGPPPLKALERLGTPPEDPSLLPTHTQRPDEDELANATYCQLLVAYRQELKRYKTEQTVAKLRMNELERLARSACEVYAQTPKYKYHCNGFPMCGLNEWYTIEGSEQDREAFNLCINSVRGGASLPERKIPARPKLSRTGEQQLSQMNQEIAAARSQALDLRKKWLKAKTKFDQAGAKVFELEKKIRDLEAQEVYC